VDHDDNNQTMLDLYRQQVNHQASIRDSLIHFVTDFSLTTFNNLKLQASTLARLTSATNQLTRSTLVCLSHLDHPLTATVVAHFSIFRHSLLNDVNN
jgi:hypothetical protein